MFQDKTFGLKNKKGAKQQKFIKNVTQQVKYGQQNPRQVSEKQTTIGLFASIVPTLLARAGGGRQGQQEDGQEEGVG